MGPRSGIPQGRRRQTQTTRTSPRSKETSCLRMRISQLIIIRKQLFSEPDVSGSTAPRLASRRSLSDLIVDIRRRVQLFDPFDRVGVNPHGRTGETRRSMGHGAESQRTEDRWQGENFEFRIANFGFKNKLSVFTIQKSTDHCSNVIASLSVRSRLKAAPTGVLFVIRYTG